MKVNPKGQAWPVAASNGSVHRPEVASADSGAATRDDQVELSDRARQLALYRHQLQNAPQVRLELVERLRNQIARGEYTVSPHDLADRLIQSKVLEP